MKLFQAVYKIVTKTLIKDISGVASDIVSAKFKKLKKNYSINLQSIFNKTFDRASLSGIELGSDKAGKFNIRKKVMAVAKMMSDDIDTISNEQSQNVARVVAQSYGMGLPSTKLKMQVKDELGKSDFKVDRAVRTGTAYLSSLTKLLTWYEQGFREYEWILGKDDKVTRPSHKRRHRKVYKIKDALEGRAPIPGRVPNADGSVNLSESMNCRCGLRIHS